jgi:hypothetical protein
MMTQQENHECENPVFQTPELNSAPRQQNPLMRQQTPLPRQQNSLMRQQSYIPPVIHAPQQHVVHRNPLLQSNNDVVIQVPVDYSRQRTASSQRLINMINNN